MKIVIDTNIILVSFSERAKSFWIAKAFVEGDFTLCVTNEILLEYEEILTKHSGPKFANVVIKTILESPYVEFIRTYYSWNLIKSDADDNKFIDWAVAAAAKYLVTEDKHFKILKTKTFPKVEIINVNAFKKLIQK